MDYVASVVDIKLPLVYTRDGRKSFFASPSQVTRHFLASPSQVTSHLVRRQVKSSHKSFGPNTSQVTRPLWPGPEVVRLSGVYCTRLAQSRKSKPRKPNEV